MLSNLKPGVLAIAALWIIGGFGFGTLGQRLWLEVRGTITSSHDTPSAGGPRYTTDYTIRGADGREFHYTAGPTDASLARSMPVGTVLNKQRWNLGYERDGAWVNDFGVTFYVVMLVIGFALLVASIVIWRIPRVNA